MSRVYNFSAGPAVLPEEVLKEVADEMMDYNGTDDITFCRFSRRLCAPSALDRPSAWILDACHHLRPHRDLLHGR